MNKHFSLFILLCLFGFYSCHESVVNTTESTPSEKHTKDTLDRSTVEKIKKYLLSPNDSSITVQFDEITIHLSPLVPFDKVGSFVKTTADTCFVSADVYESILGGQLRIISNSLTDFKIEQAYQTSVSISNEGPHCDLLDWKHFTSNWKVLQLTKNGFYSCLNYTQKEGEIFPQVDVDELKSEVKKHCGEEMYDLVKNSSEIRQYPIGIGISSVFIRLKGKMNGKTIIKIIAVDEAMGC